MYVKEETIQPSAEKLTHSAILIYCDWYNDHSLDGTLTDHEVVIPMQVNFYAALREIIRKKKLDFELEEGVSVSELIHVIACEYPDLGEKLINESGQIYNHIHILINGRDVLSLQSKLETKLREDDVINIFPAIGGGYL